MDGGRLVGDGLLGGGAFEGAAEDEGLFDEGFDLGDGGPVVDDGGADGEAALEDGGGGGDVAALLEVDDDLAVGVVGALGAERKQTMLSSTGARSSSSGISPMRWARWRARAQVWEMTSPRAWAP
jgi:hypothetical protein